MPAAATRPDPKSADTVRVVHTADWHLGKMLGDLDRAAEHRRFLAWLQLVLVREQVDVLVVAGDVFDTANPPQSAERMYFEFLANVYRETQCAVVVSGGNHDSPAHLEAPRRVLHPLNVHVTGGMPEKIEDLLVPIPSAEQARLVIAAVPFLRDRDLRTGCFGQTADEIREELRDGIGRVYQRAEKACEAFAGQGAAMLATGHLTVSGARPSDSERVVHVGGLGKVDHNVFPGTFSYVALGHLHRPQEMGSPAIRYSGSPIALSFSECEDVKEVRLLDFANGTLTANQALAIPPARHLAQLKTVREHLESALAAFEPPVGALPTWVEVIVETNDPGENLFECVRELTAARREEFEVIRVHARRERAAATLCESDAASFHDVDALLDDPCEVFELRLAMANDLSDADAQNLRVAFRELYQLHLDQEIDGKVDAPEEVTAAAQPPRSSAAPAVATEELLLDFGEREDSA